MDCTIINVVASSIQAVLLRQHLNWQFFVWLAPSLLLGNVLVVGLAVYLVHLGGGFSAANGARHGAVAGLTANGFLNIFVYAFFTCDGGHIFPLGEAIIDIVANVVFMAATGAVIGILYQRDAAKSASLRCIERPLEP